MSVFKCKMCGGDLVIDNNTGIAECEYCGTEQTVPKAMDENMQNLFNRANTLRLKCEFDKAAKLYEKLVQADSTQSEAYWGLILCKYGIEYVDDPTTFKKIPTCHRTSYDSVTADEDYKSAMEYADLSQRAIYEEQAKEIDRLQKDILALARKEETYDVFICYKETDDSGARTKDNVIANDIYYQLTQQGFKVFYAAITLEGKLGSAYEPIIFAALNSAKVMLVIGTKPEYFNAVWVKNEWSRFLKIMQKDRSKLLIPCYRGMDAYELPEEFAHLQAQDMSKIGFINDVVRGISKVISDAKPKQEVQQTVIVNASETAVAPLLERVQLFLEDGKWADANTYCEKVLDAEPKNAEAYLGKLMADLRVRKRSDLANKDKPFDNNDNYQKVIRFGDEKLVNELQGYIVHIKEAENSRVYNYATDLMRRERYSEAADNFERLGNYRDSQSLYELCSKKAIDEQKNEIYDEARQKMEYDDIRSYADAIKLFETIPDWRDSAKCLAECKRRMAEIRARDEAIRQAEENRRNEEERRRREEREAEEKAAKSDVLLLF